MRPLVSSPGGKFKLAKKIIQLFPPHKIYVEPFCGSASVALAKKPSEKDVISDIDDFAFCYKFLKEANDETINALEKMEWQAKPSLYNKLKQFEAKSDVDRFRKFFYVRRHTYGTKANGVMNPQPTNVNVNKFRMLRDGLKHIDVYQDDYKNMVRKYDSPDTFFFFDPPYHQSWGKEWGQNKFDFKEFVQVLKNLKGKFLLTYEDDKDVRKELSGFRFKKLPVIRTLDGTNNVQQDYDLLVSNYDPQKNTVYLSEEDLEADETLFYYIDFERTDDDVISLRMPIEMFYEIESKIQCLPKTIAITEKGYEPSLKINADLKNDIDEILIHIHNETFNTFPGWDSDGSEIKYRLKEPSLFQKDSFVRKEIKKEEPRVVAIMAKLSGEETLTIQSLRFPKKDGWTTSSAQDWYKEHYKPSKNNSEFDAVIDKIVNEWLKRAFYSEVAEGEVFNNLRSKVVSGLYLPGKYVSLVKNGSAKAIVKARSYNGMLDKPLWLCDDKTVHGVVKLTDCKEINSVEEFKNFADQHKMDDNERVHMFGKDRNKFYLYNVSRIAKLPSPVPYVWKSGIQGFVKTVQFVPLNKGGDDKTSHA